MENGQAFIPPILTKLPEKPRPVLLWCDHCNKPIRTTGEHASGGRYLLYEGGPDEPALIFSVWCHGDEISIGIGDISSFMNKLAKHRAPRDGVVDAATEWWHLFTPS